MGRKTKTVEAPPVEAAVEEKGLFIAHQDNIIWGIGTTILEAAEDGVKVFKEHHKRAPEATEIMVLACSEALYDEVKRVGGQDTKWFTDAELVAHLGEAPVNTVAIEAPAKTGTLVLDGISRRHHERLNLSAGSREMGGPDISDPESIKAHNDALKELGKRWAAGCSGVNKDTQVLLGTIFCIQAEHGIDVHEIANRVYEANLTEKEKAAREAEKKAEEKRLAKERGECDGQIKLNFDDGSEAEAAGECTTRQLEEGEDVTAPIEQAEEEAGE